MSMVLGIGFACLAQRHLLSGKFSASFREQPHRIHTALVGWANHKGLASHGTFSPLISDWSEWACDPFRSLLWNLHMVAKRKNLSFLNLFYLDKLGYT